MRKRILGYVTEDEDGWDLEFSEEVRRDPETLDLMLDELERAIGEWRRVLVRPVPTSW